MANEQESAAPQSDGSSENIEELVAQCLLRVEADGQDGLSEFLSQHQDAASQIKKRIAWLADMGLVTLPADSKIDLSPDHSGVYRTLRESRSAPESVSDGDGFGHYRVVKELGRGGQAIVYLADDTRLNRKVALKVMTGFGDFDDAALARFQREAEVASRLDDPGICTVYESGAFDKTAYIAMRLVDGETLGERIKRARDDDRDEPASLFFDLDDATEEAPSDSETNTVPDRIDVMRTIEVVERTARALHTAHEAGVIHRDIKPGNIMVTREGDPVVLDFGLAGDTESDLQTLTREGDFFGTPAYMSPEQLAANRITVDRRTDVYSLGVLLYECLTLERPFQVPTREALYQAILTEEPSSPRSINPAISPDLEVVIATAMDKNRDRRYQTAEDLAEELRRVREHEPIQARPASTATRVLRWTQRNPARATATVAIVLILLISAALITWSLGESQRAQLSEDKTVAEQKARGLETLRAEEAEAEREQLRAQDRERVFRERLLELATSEGVTTGSGAGDVRSAAREYANNYFDAFDAFGLSLMNESGVDAVIRDMERVGKDDVPLQNQIRDALYDAAFVLTQAGVVQAVAIRDGRPPAQLTPEQVEEFKGVLASAPEAVARWDRLSGILASETVVWRRRIWAEIVSAGEAGRIPDLGEFTSDAHLREQSASTLVWLARALMAGGDVVGLLDNLPRIERIIDMALDKQSSDLATIYVAWFTKGVSRFTSGMGLTGAVSAEDKRLAWEEALRAFKIIRDLRPSAHIPHQWIARVSLALGRSEAARAAFDRALALAPDHAASTRVNYAEGLFQGGDPAAASEIFQELVDTNPDVATYHRYLGDVLMHGLGAVDDAVIAYRRALELDPNQVQAYVNLSLFRLQSGDAEAAFDILQRAIEVAPGQRQIRNMMAMTLARLQDPVRAKAVFEKFRAALPNSAEPFLLEGQVSAMRGQQQAALKAFEQAVEADARSRESWIAVAQLLSSVDESRARVICREGLEIWPDDVDLHRLLTLSLWRDAEPAEAVAVGRRAVELGVAGFSINLALGGSLAATGAFSESIPLLEKAETLAKAANGKPEWPLSALVSGLMATGDMEGARRATERWIDATSTSADPHLLLSGLDAFLGDYEASLARLLKVRELSAEGSSARAVAEDILAIQPVVRGVAEPKTALDLLRASRAAIHRWETRRCADLFDEGYKRAKASATLKGGPARLAEGALDAARAAAMMGRGLGREYVPPLVIRDEAGAPLLNPEGQVRFIDSRSARLLGDLLDDDARAAANARAFNLLRTCVDEVLAGLSATEDKGEVKRLRRVLKHILDDPFLVIFQYPPKDAPWAARATALIERVAEQWLRER